ISFYTQSMEEDELFPLYDKLKTANGIYRSTYQANLTYPCMTKDLPSDFLKNYRQSVDDKSTGKTLELPLDVQFIEDGIYFDFIKSLGLPITEYAGLKAKFLIICINTVQHTTYFTNSSMNFRLISASGEQAKTITTTFVDSYPLDILPRDSSAPMPAYLFMMIAPWQTKTQFDALGIPAKFGLTFWSENPAQSIAEIQSIIEESGIIDHYTLLNLSNAVDLFRSSNFVIDVFTYVFVIMISLIGVANVFNTISTNIRLRRRELAMLRSVGMSDHALNKMMYFECIFYGTRTLLFGVPIAGIISWLIFEGLVTMERMDNLSFLFPWGSILISVLGVFLIVFITMFYATSKIKKENIIDALRDDMD
ncbi:MAG: ABC transporter permease, partial [Lachnospiraceae bacterium]